MSHIMAYDDIYAKQTRRLVIQQLRNLIQLLGRTPTREEVCQKVAMTSWRLGRLFVRNRTDTARGYRRAMRLAGATPRPRGVHLRGAKFDDSAKAMRQLTRLDAALASREEVSPRLRRRCDCGGIIQAGTPHTCGRTA
jgi:hypothetical protein